MYRDNARCMSLEQFLVLRLCLHYSMWAQPALYLSSKIKYTRVLHYSNILCILTYQVHAKDNNTVAVYTSLYIQIG